MEQLRVDGESYGFHKLDAAAVRLPYTLRILLENVLRHGDDEGAEAVAGWVADAEPSREISFHPARVLLQDFTGVPAVVDLAAMRDAMRDQGGDPNAINPQIPVELVIDHSVQVDEFASRLAIERNVELEFDRNRKSTRLNSSHLVISYAVFCLKKKKTRCNVHTTFFFRHV